MLMIMENGFDIKLTIKVDFELLHTMKDKFPLYL